MAIIAWWNDHQFEISPSVIRGFTEMQIKGASETEDKTDEDEKYASWKNANAIEQTFTAHLSAYFGCDVRKEAMAYVDEARAGRSGYFYAYYNNQWSKLLRCKMMLTAATVNKIAMAPTGKWISADVQLTLKSCAVSDEGVGASGSGSSGGGGSSGGYSKASVKSTSASAATGSSWLQRAAKTVQSTAQKASEKAAKAAAQAEEKAAAVSRANSAISRLISSARSSARSSVKSNTTSGGGSKVVAMTK